MRCKFQLCGHVPGGQAGVPNSGRLPLAVTPLLVHLLLLVLATACQRLLPMACQHQVCHTVHCRLHAQAQVAVSEDAASHACKV